MDIHLYVVIICTGTVDWRPTWGSVVSRPNISHMVLKHKPKNEGQRDRTVGDHETVSTHVSACPDCDAAVVDGQGLLSCVDCDWRGLVA